MLIPTDFDTPLEPIWCATESPCLPSSNFVFPVHEYSHAGGRCSVTGGFIYRGSEFPSLVGQYFFTDYCSADFYSLATPDNGMTWNTTSYEVVSQSGKRRLSVSTLSAW